MAKLRHVAVICDDVEWATKFYSEVFGLTEAGRHGNELTEVVDLTDGVVNVALYKPLLPSHPDIEEPVGMNHIGFVVDDVEEAVARAEALGCVVTEDPRETPDQSCKEIWGMRLRAPDGTAFDFSWKGWVGQSQPSRRD